MDRFLAGRFSLPVIVLVGVGLTLPSLGVGWVIDDLSQRLRMLGSEKLPEVPRDPSAIFEFASGEPADTARLLDRGLWPWWTCPDIKASFWRPLSVLTHQLDYFLWPDNPLLMHAQSIAWYGLLVFLAALLFRRFLGATLAAGLAGLLYAIDDAHGMPVGFLSNRNAIVATVFGVAAILAHDRWRRGNSMRHGVAAYVLFALSLLSAEAGVGALGYIIAHAIALDRGPFVRRICILWPYFLILAAWRAVWHASGAGINGVGFYVDPLAEPGRFIAETMIRGPILLLGQFAFPPSDLYLATCDLGWESYHSLFAFAVVIAVGIAFRPLLVRNRVARFWGLGTLLSLPPICATFSSDRLLFFTGLGAFGLIAQWITESRVKPSGRGIAMALNVVHLGVAPIGLAARSAMPVGPPSFVNTFLVPSSDEPEVERQTLVIVSGPILFSGTYALILPATQDQPVPRAVRYLSTVGPPAWSPAAMEIARPDDRTLLIRPDGGFLASALDRLARRDGIPFSVGDSVRLSDMRAEVGSVTIDGRPWEVAFVFDRSLDVQALRWLIWNGSEYTPFVPPGIGERTSHRSK